MPSKVDGLYARRSLCPAALRGVLRGVVPVDLARHLKLPANSKFEKLDPAWVDLADALEDRRLLDRLTESIDQNITSWKIDCSSLAFPDGIPLAMNLDRLPLHTRTRNCLKKAALYSAEGLQGLSLEELLAIPAFGVKCLVDLLTAVEGARGIAEIVALPAAEDSAGSMLANKHTSGVKNVASVLGVFEGATLSPRLTREASLLRNEPWSRDVSLYDVRLGSGLLRDESAFHHVREWLDAGRFGLEQRLYAEVPHWDINLLRCPLQSRTRNCLRDAGITTISTLGPRALRDVRELAGMGESALVDLLVMLDVCRFPATAAAPTDREPTLADFCEGVVNRTNDSWFPERLADRIHQTRAHGIRCLSLPLEEELRDITASLNSHSADVVIEYLGWGGQGIRTLESVGKSKGLTRERVRQKVSKLTDRLSEISAWTPTLRQALDFCLHTCPLPAAEIATLLRQNGLTAVLFHPHGLLTAFECLGLTHPFSLRTFEGSDWLFKGDQEALLRKSAQIARSIVTRRGVCSLGDLQAEISDQTSQTVLEETLREWLNGLSGVRWMDQGQLWFRFPGQGSSLETALWKIMAVAREIRMGELREGLLRHYRSASAPPSAVLRQLCQQLGLMVEGDLIRVGEASYPEDVLSKVELTFYEILRDEGPLFESVELERRCMGSGMNQSTFWVYLMYSPILARYATGIYGLRGAQFAPGEAEALRSRRGRTRIVLDHGWRKNGSPWIGYRITEAVIRSGVVSVPAGMRDALGEGSWPLETTDGVRVGNLVCRAGTVWGLGPYFNRRGADVDDIMILEIDRRSALATIRLGGPELLDQIHSDIDVSLDPPDAVGNQQGQSGIDGFSGNQLGQGA